MYENFIPFNGWILFYYMYVPHFVHSSVDEHLVCFHLLAIVNSAAINIGIQYLFESLFSILLSIC